jgi:S-adenosylmethionine:tRNA ribosyltransferase-isomerase
LDRKKGTYEHKRFNQLVDYLAPGDLVVVNRSRVIPGRLHARKQLSGGNVEVLLLERLDPFRWKALVGGKRIKTGSKLEFGKGVTAEIIADLGGAQREIAFARSPDGFLEEIGDIPLPPYLTELLEDPDRYQTVFSKEPGSAAAPTAGLHFTPELIGHLKRKGIGFAEVLLHVGLDTFAPVTEENAHEHQIHSEWFRLPREAAAAVNSTRKRGKRVIAVGTTTVRVLESAYRMVQAEGIAAFEGRTDLFILPGFEFRVVDALITNFHLPRSTLLMLVSAFAGREGIFDAYREAISKGYRFYSFGDAMLIL